MGREGGGKQVLHQRSVKKQRVGQAGEKSGRVEKYVCWVRKCDPEKEKDGG